MTFGFAEGLTIVFVILKLTHVIGWAWGFVFLPVIISWGIALLMITILGLIVALKK